MKIPTPNEFTAAQGYKPFPPRWEKWLSAVRDDILSAQPSAGRHTTISEHPGKGTVVNAADSKDRGRLPPSGIPCALPVGATCPHAICFELKLDSSDTSGRDFIDVQSGHNILLGIYFDGTSWQLYTWTSSDSMVAVDPFDTWHTFALQFKSASFGTTVDVEWFVDGVSQGTVQVMDSGESASKYIANNVIFGARYGSGDPHRTLRNITTKANPPTSEVDFNFPPDSFSSLHGGATAISGVLQIDSSDADCYAEKDYTPAYDLLCTPVEGCFCIGNVEMSVTVEVSMTHGLDGDGNPCNFFVHKEETLVTQFGEDLCQLGYGPFEFTYPGYDVGTIFVPSVIIGLSGPDPPPICVVFNVQAGFEQNACGSGVVDYASGPDDNCFTVCDPPGVISQTWTTDLGSGDYQTVTMTLTIS